MTFGAALGEDALAFEAKLAGWEILPGDYPEAEMGWTGPEREGGASLSRRNSFP